MNETMFTEEEKVASRRLFSLAAKWETIDQACRAIRKALKRYDTADHPVVTVCLYGCGVNHGKIASFVLKYKTPPQL